MCCGCSKEPSHRDGSFEYPQHMFWLRNKKNIFQLHNLSGGLTPTLFSSNYHVLAHLLSCYVAQYNQMTRLNTTHTMYIRYMCLVVTCWERAVLQHVL